MQVGAGALARVLHRLRQDVHVSPHVLSGLDSPDDAAVLAAPPAGHVSVQVSRMKQDNLLCRGCVLPSVASGVAGVCVLQPSDARRGNPVHQQSIRDPVHRVLVRQSCEL